MATLDDQLAVLGIKSYFRLKDAPRPCVCDELVARVEWRSSTRFVVVTPAAMQALIDSRLCVNEIVLDGYPLFAPFDIDMYFPAKEGRPPVERLLRKANSMLDSFCAFVGVSTDTKRCITHASRDTGDGKFKVSIHAVLAARFASPDALQRHVQAFKLSRTDDELARAIDAAIYAAPVQKRVPFTPKQSDTGDVHGSVHSAWACPENNMLCPWFTPLQRAVACIE